MPRTIVKTCPACMQQFDAPIKEHNRGHAKYCSIPCANIGKRGGRPKDENCTCAWCGKSFYMQPSKFQNSKHGLHFCSRLCKDTAQRLESGFPQLRPSHYGRGRFHYRQIAFRSKPYVCEKCGYDKLPIHDVHHLDGDRSNNTPSNLQVLCPTCHVEKHYRSGTGRYHSKN